MLARLEFLLTNSWPHSGIIFPQTGTILLELYWRSCKGALQKPSGPRCITDHLALREDKRGLSVTACSRHPTEKIQGDTSAVSTGPGKHQTRPLARKRPPHPPHRQPHPQTPRGRRRVTPASWIPSGWAGLCVLRPSLVIPPVAPRIWLPPERSFVFEVHRDPCSGPQLSSPAKRIFPIPAPFGDLPLLTDLGQHCPTEHSVTIGDELLYPPWEPLVTRAS